MQTTLSEGLWPQSRSSLLNQALLVVAGTVALAISAKVHVPFYPVPMTMQTLVVLLIGATYGSKLGGVTLFAYLAEGAAGLPVFAKGAGLAYLAGPTGGYLIGFALAAIIIGFMAERGFGKSFMSALPMMFVGHVVIFALGVGWLATFTGFEKAIALGLTPFLIPAVAKLLLATLLLPSAWKLVRR